MVAQVIPGSERVNGMYLRSSTVRSYTILEKVIACESLIPMGAEVWDVSVRE